MLSTTVYEYDEQQHVVKTMHGNGQFSTTEWMCCGVLNETDEDGITPETITEYTRDAAERVLCTTRRIGAMETTESSEYDALRRVTKQTDILGRETTTAYSADGLTTTVTTPAGATSIITRNTDDSTARVAGTGQRELVYVYDLNGVNEGFTTKLPSGEILSRSINNAFGQTTVHASPNTLGGFIYTRSEYNACLLIKYTRFMLSCGYYTTIVVNC